LEELLPLAVVVAVAVRLELLAWPQTELLGRAEMAALEQLVFMPMEAPQ
jgi:hypothetical protein